MMIELLEPWESPRDDADRTRLEDELRREISRHHQLSGKSVHAFARRVDRDDVVFVIDGGPQVATVHLTYSVEVDPSFPITHFYDSIEEFCRIRMKPDHEEYLL